MKQFCLRKDYPAIKPTGHLIQLVEKKCPFCKLDFYITQDLRRNEYTILNCYFQTEGMTQSQFHCKLQKLKISLILERVFILPVNARKLKNPLATYLLMTVLLGSIDYKFLQKITTFSRSARDSFEDSEIFTTVRRQD